MENGMINVMTLKLGDRLLLLEGVLAEVIENMGDGMWVQVKYLAVPGRPSEVGSVELCHAQDIVRLIETPQKE